MANVYKSYGKYSAPFDSERCKASVPFGGRSVAFRQCQRGPKLNGWCHQHHPDAEAKRDKEAEERYEAKLARSPYRKIEALKAENTQLRKALQDIIDECPSPNLPYGHAVVRIARDAIAAAKGAQ